ncbi:MAG: sulfurtransferase [Acidimicrobiales bacterium]|nr:sulfurtransferase [Acidimicrobiales bacterium]RZV43994.1 MAG: sulfurtransferase [Acidimicrobiales bacterium]
MELPGPLVTADWLYEHLTEVRVIDVRWAIDTGPQHDAYVAAHIPGAVFADLDVDLSGPPGEGGRHPLPTPEAFADTRTHLGLGDVPVVAYDNRGGPVASRLWWMLDAIGVPAAVLDGGVSAWRWDLESGDYSVLLDEAVAPIEWPSDRLIEADAIPAALDAGSVLIDARSRERFRGDPNPTDDPAGHIPGAVSHPWDENITDDGVFADVDTLRARLLADGITADSAVLASCGSGVTACHNLLAARLCGVADTKLYVGSWSQWSKSGRPVETGE